MYVVTENLTFSGEMLEPQFNIGNQAVQKQSSKPAAAAAAAAAAASGSSGGSGDEVKYRPTAPQRRGSSPSPPPPSLSAPALVRTITVKPSPSKEDAAAHDDDGDDVVDGAGDSLVRTSAPDPAVHPCTAFKTSRVRTAVVSRTCYERCLHMNISIKLHDCTHQYMCVTFDSPDGDGHWANKPTIDV